MKNLSFILVLTFLFFSCGSKKIVTEKEITEFKNTIEQNTIKFVANSANPVAFANVRGINNLMQPGSNSSNILLNSTDNFVIVKNDSIKIDLPYFGEQQISRGYNTKGGLLYTGVKGEENKKFNSKKNTYTLAYKSLKGENENLTVYLELFENKSGRLTVNSSHRTSISYFGKWEKVE